METDSPWYSQSHGTSRLLWISGSENTRQLPITVFGRFIWIKGRFVKDRKNDPKELSSYSIEYIVW